MAGHLLGCQLPTLSTIRGVLQVLRNPSLIFLTSALAGSVTSTGSLPLVTECPIRWWIYETPYHGAAPVN